MKIQIKIFKSKIKIKKKKIQKKKEKNSIDNYPKKEDPNLQNQSNKVLNQN